MDILQLIVVFLIACSGICYLTIQGIILVGLRRTERSFSNNTPFVSVIVAARNEQASIPFLLERLLQQTYPLFEIILVNDRSTDGTLAIMEKFRHPNNRIKIVSIPHTNITSSPKKNALKAAIEHSSGEILCFTDADCLPQKTWIEGIVRYFDDKTGLVTGPVFFHYDGPSPIRFFWDYEEFKKAIFTAGSIGWNYAWLAKGGNMAYRKKVFEEIGGFRSIEHSLGGDDDLLVQVVQRTTAWKVRYAGSPECIVTTSPTTRLSGFLRQRRRHVSASKHYPIQLKIMLIIFHFSNLIILLNPFYTAFHPSILFLSLFFILLKIVIDMIQLRVIGNRIMVYFPLIQYPQAEFLFLLYHFIIAPVGLLGISTWRKE